MSTSLRLAASAVALAGVALLGTAGITTGIAVANGEHAPDAVSADAHWCC